MKVYRTFGPVHPQWLNQRLIDSGKYSKLYSKTDKAMKKLTFGLTWVAALFMAGSLTSCQSEDVVSSADDNAVAVNAVAHVTIGEDTRTSYTPGESSFKFAWSTGDKIVVLSEDGNRNIGVMTLSGEGGQSFGDFEGILNVRPNDTKVNVYYLGRKSTSNLNQLASSASFSIGSQNTDLASVTDYDVMHSVAELSRDELGKVSMNFTVKSVISIARFCFHLPEGVSATNEAVTVKGANIFNSYTLNFADASFTDQNPGAINIVPDWSKAEGGDAFMTFVPAANAVTEFEVTVGEKTYKATLDARTYGAGKFFCGGQPLHGKDIYFSEEGEWTLSYDANKGTNAPQAEVKGGVFSPSCSFTVTEMVPVREGYKFLGWADSADATLAKYNAGSQITLTRPETSKTIYAVWQEEEWHHRTYTLHYDQGNGSTIDDSQTFGQYCSQPWVFYTDNYTDAYPTKTGYTFLGWADTENASTVVYAKTGATIDLTKEVFEKTVYPVWKKNGAEGNVTAPGSDRKPY